MISNQILQTTVDGLKAISRVDFCVIDADGKVAAKTFEDAQNCIADAIAFMDSPAESQVHFSTNFLIFPLYCTVCCAASTFVTSFNDSFS